MSVLSPQQVAALTHQYFGDLGPQVVADMTATFLAESGGDTAAHNPANPDGSQDDGLTQINSAHGFDPQRLRRDPGYAMQAARQVYDQQGIQAWSTWNDGAALTHWDAAAQAVTQLYSQAPAPPAAAAPSGWRSHLAATIQQAGLPAQPGSTPVVNPSPAAAPQTAVTGDEVTKLYYWVLQQLQALATGPSGVTGQYPSELTGGAAGTYSPTLAAQQLAQVKASADQNYQLNLQRYGLDYATEAFNQEMQAGQQQLQYLQLQTQRQGPGDWLRYNYIINNKPAPLTATVGANAPTGFAPPQPTLNLTGVPGPAVPNGDQARGAAMAAAINAGTAPNPSSVASGYVSPGQMGASGVRNDTGKPQQNGQPVPAIASPAASNAPAQDSTPGYTTTPGGGVSLSAPEITAGAQWEPSPNTTSTPAGWEGMGYTAGEVNGTQAVPMLAFGGDAAPVAGAPLQGEVIPPQAGQAPPTPGGPQYLQWLLSELAKYVDMGMPPNSQPHAAVVGDPQQGDQANPELAVSQGPMTVMPLDKRALAAKTAARLPHRASGGDVPAVDPSLAPFITKLTGGGPAFSGRGESLGPLGQSPFNYSNYLQLLPSEQAMLEGYVDTPTDQGGLGGYFPDELQRAKAGTAVGPRDFPYRQTAGVGYGD